MPKRFAYLLVRELDQTGSAVQSIRTVFQDAHLALLHALKRQSPEKFHQYALFQPLSILRLSMGSGRQAHNRS